MWPLPQINKQHIHVIITEDCIAYYWIETERNNFFTIKAHQTHEFITASHDIFYNLMNMHNSIVAFITKYNLTHATAHYVIAAPFAYEQLTEHTKSNASLAELIGKSHEQMRYAHDYIGTREQQHLYYVSGMPQALLLQLALLHNRMHLYMQSVRSPLNAQLNLYNILHNKQISQAQLSRAIDPETMRIEELFNPGTLQALLTHKIEDSIADHLVYALASHTGVAS